MPGGARICLIRATRTNSQLSLQDDLIIHYLYLYFSLALELAYQHTRSQRIFLIFIVSKEITNTWGCIEGEWGKISHRGFETEE